MSEMLGRLAGFDPVAGLLSLPLWTAGAAAALLVVLSLFAFSRAGREGLTGASARVALLLIGVAAAFIGFGWMSKLDMATERRALDARAQELLMRSALPGSAFACLDAIAGDAVETSCEKAVFQTPEATAAALSYVSAQLALLADVAAHARRSGADPAALSNLKRAVEADRYGLVARVLAVRDNCTPAACSVFAMLDDPGRISINLAERTYDLYVTRHAAAWPTSEKLPVAAAPAGEGGAPSVAAGRGGLYLPSAASIPPVSIMNAEPALPSETTSSTVPSATRQAPPPPRRPAQPGNAAAGGASVQPARPPIDLNAVNRPPQ